MLAGGIGGTSGDMLMHSLDTVKTRQQGDLRLPPRYTTLSSSYMTIWRQEGILRGLYSGVVPAFLGSFPGTLIFFGVYEAAKRNLLDRGCNATLAYLAGGFVADLAASVVYVPSEVLKTRLQLQGRHNNPFFTSGYNYRSTLDAFRTIVRTEGVAALFHGYKATIFRDLPFSALQFAFYEQEQALARQWMGGSRDIGLGLEILTATTAGGLAGVITCPLDVVKTRIQTRVNEPMGSSIPSRSSHSQPRASPASASASTAFPACPQRHLSTSTSTTASTSTTTPTISSQPSPSSVSTSSSSSSSSPQQVRHIGTTGPSNLASSAAAVRAATSTAPKFDTSSVLTGLRLLYASEGLAGWFRGVGPRGVWTSVQSGTMLVCYQMLLRRLERWRGVEREERDGSWHLG